MASHYNGNQNLKSSGVSINFTPKQIEEIVRCAEDPVYFIENYCMIVSLDKGLVPFKLYDCQKNKVKIINENRKVILMESRQSGKTTTSAAYILWYTLFDMKAVAILANKASAARECLRRYKIMFEHLPEWLQQGVNVWNKGDIELENGSRVFTAATSISGIRGGSVNMLYVDETAIVPNNIAEEFFTSVYPTISAGETTKILLSSTPLGYNHFWKFWNEAEQGRNGFVPLFIPYTDIPGRDEKWAEEQRKNLGPLKFTQEVLCQFLGSSLTLIDANILSTLSAKPPIYSKDGLDVYEEPVRKVERDAQGNLKTTLHAYVMVVDTAKGVGGDYSAFTVMDVTSAPYKVVAKYRNNRIAPMLYPNVIEKIAREYNEAYVLIEINSSEQVANILYSELEYENILMVTRSVKGQIISAGFGGIGKTQLGVNTDKKIKRTGCTTFKTLVEEKKLIFFDADIISECTTFIEKKNSYQADDGYNDDLVMTLVLFGWATTCPYFKEICDVNLREIMYKERIERIDAEMIPMGFFSDGTEALEEKIFNF